MGAFISNIQVFSEGKDTSMLLDKLENAITYRLINGVYEIADDADSADRSLILQMSSERWISVYDQKLDEQDINAMDAIGTTISRLGVPAVGSIVHDSDLLMMRLYRNGGTADTIVNDLDIFNEMMEGSRRRKRNGLASKWAEVCAPGVEPAALKELWERETIFAEDALARGAELLGIPVNAALRGYKIDPEFQQDGAIDGQVRVLHFRSLMRLPDFVQVPDGPKLAFTSWNSFAVGDVGSESKITFGLQSQGQAFTGLDVLLWGPALDEKLIEAGEGTLIHTREEYGDEPELLELEAVGKEFNGYRYRFSEIEYPEGGLLSLYPGEAAQLGLMREWMEQMNQLIYSFQVTLIGKSVGKSTIYIGFAPKEAPEKQLGIGIPVYIGVEPDSE
jgi:hypothetical protein